MNRITEMRNRPPASSISTARNNKRKTFYHSTSWRKTRAAYMKMKRKQHEYEIVQVYRENQHKNDPQSIVDFLYSDLPLSEQSLAEGIIRLANVCDHIRPISEGGSKTDFSNLQMLTASEHQIKTNRENNLTKGKHF